jgi:hypothetical protein
MESTPASSSTTLDSVTPKVDVQKSEEQKKKEEENLRW